MSGFYGADTDALRDVAGIFQDRSRRLEELRETLTATVMREDIWTGADADAFRDRWSGVGSQLDDAASEVGRRRGALEEEAEQQDGASGTGGDGGGLLGALGDFWDSIQGGLGDALKVAKDLWKARQAFQLFGDLQRLGAAGFEGLKGLINQQYIDDLLNPIRAGGTKVMDFLNSKGFTRLADLTEGLLDSGVVKGAGELLGKALPVLDIGMGIHQIATAEDGWDVAAGGLSVLSGGLLLAAPFTGPFAPIVAGAGLVAGGVSLAIDAGKAVVENWDAITETAGDAWDATTGAVSDAWDATTGAVEDVVSDPIGAIGSLF